MHSCCNNAIAKLHFNTILEQTAAQRTILAENCDKIISLIDLKQATYDLYLLNKTSGRSSCVELYAKCRTITHAMYCASSQFKHTPAADAD